MNVFKSFISKEFSHFRSLSQQGQRLIIAILVYNIADPLLFLFVSAFIWRNSKDIILIAVYYLAWCIAVPSACYINGVLLKRFRPSQLFMLGTLLQGLIVFLLVFVSNINYFSIIACGFVLGLGSGFFWANRTFLTLRATNSTSRIYFASLEAVAGIALSIIIPLIAGWFIIFGDKIQLYTINAAYKILSVFSLAILFLSGYVIRNINVNILPVLKINLSKVSNSWKNIRILTFLSGFFTGINLFFPAYIILKFVGNEGILGTIQSFAAVLSAVGVYIVGRKVKKQNRYLIFGFAIILILLATSSFAIFYFTLGTLLVITFMSLCAPLYGVAFSSLIKDSIDREKSDSLDNHFSFIFDQEVYLNVGRVTGILLLLLSYNLYGDFGLRFLPLVLATSQIAMFWYAKKIDLHNAT